MHTDTVLAHIKRGNTELTLTKLATNSQYAVFMYNPGMSMAQGYINITTYYDNLADAMYKYNEEARFLNSVHPFA